MRALMVLWAMTWGAGCKDASDAPTAVDPPLLDGCQVDAANALRVLCRVERLAPVDVSLTLIPRIDAPTRVFAGTSDGVVGWALVPNTTYDWTLTDATGAPLSAGEVQTGSLPADLPGEYTVEPSEPEASGLELLLIPSVCSIGYLLMLDPQGRVVWYMSVGDATGGAGFLANAVAWTEHGTILVIANRSVVSEVTPTGEVVFTAVSSEAFDGPVHHDVFERDGFVYVPHSRQGLVEGTLYVIDQILVFDHSGAVVDAIDTLDLYPYDGVRNWMFGGYWAFAFVGAVDFTHLNSVYVDGAGDVWVSFRHLHAFAKLRGGPGTEGFGELLFTAVGDDSSPLVSDLARAGVVDPTFSGQHDVHLARDGTLLLLDNGLPPKGTSRAVRYVVDEEAHTLTATQAWDVGAVCPVQGSARELANGDVVVACPAAGTVQEFTPDGREVWSVTATCDGAVGAPLTRAVPVSL